MKYAPEAPYRRWLYIWFIPWILLWYMGTTYLGANVWTSLVFCWVAAAGWIGYGWVTWRRHKHTALKVLVIALVLAGLGGLHLVTAPSADAATIKCSTYSHTKYIYKYSINSHYALASVRMSGQICGYVPGRIIQSRSYTVADVQDATAGDWSGVHTWSRGVYYLGSGVVYPGTYSEQSYVVMRVYFGSRMCWATQWSRICTDTAYYHASFRLYSSKYGTQYFLWTTGLVAENSAASGYTFTAPPV